MHFVEAVLSLGAAGEALQVGSFAANFVRMQRSNNLCQRAPNLPASARQLVTISLEGDQLPNLRKGSPAQFELRDDTSGKGREARRSAAKFNLARSDHMQIVDGHCIGELNGFLLSFSQVCRANS